MEQPAANSNAVKFGLFEVDLQARELRKSGVKIKLNEQPFRVLALLLERPGEIVTRDELRTRLWPADTFVDFDLSLNSAVKKLRQALGDESDNPRFVETLYRRGYRFIAPVQFPSSQASDLSGSSPSTRPPDTELRAENARVDYVSTRRRAVIAGVCVAVLLAGFAYKLIPRPSPRVVGFTQITSGGKVHPMCAMVSDGRRLYFQASEQDRIALAEVSVSGGDSALLASPFQSTFLGDIAPDGSSIMISGFEGTDSSKKSPIWLLPLPAGAPQPLGLTQGKFAVWSPDGSRLLTAGGPDLFEGNRDGSNARKLAALGAPVSDMRISPDGRKIRVTISDLKTNSSQIWELNRDGSQPHPLLPNWNDSGHECCGQWTPDGKNFIFSSLRNGRNNLWALPERHWYEPKAAPVQLTNGPLDFWLPIPSRDGKRIFAMGGLPRSEVLRYDGRSFLPFLGGVSASDLAFSADGRRVAYISIPEQTLWSSKIDGSDRIQLSPSGPGSMEAGLPRWSPDGSQIVFMARMPNTDWRAYLVSANGQDLRELIPGATAGFDPGWSPDGKSIVLATGDLGATSNKISVVDLKSGSVTPIPGGENLFGPRWSPDGRYIAAVTTASDALMLYDRNDQKWTELARMGIGYPSWSRDGKYLYFDTIFSEDPTFFRVRISDRKLEQLASLKGIQRFWGMFAEWSGLGPDDSLLITRNLSSPEIYALDWHP